VNAQQTVSEVSTNSDTIANQDLSKQTDGGFDMKPLESRQVHEGMRLQDINEQAPFAAFLERRGSPFGRCPVDVLQIIFEFATELPLRSQEIQGYSGRSPGIGAALRFSGVCRWWRKVAWETPRLWTGIYYDLDDPEYVQYQAEHVIRRARLLPCSVYITTLQSNTASCLPECRLQEFPAIKVLEFCLESSMDIERLLEPSFKPPTGTMEGLHLDCAVTTILPPPQVDLLRVASIFPPFALLRVDKVQSLLFEPQKINSHITKLQVIRARKIDFLSIFRCFPNLENLYIREAELKMVGQQSRYTCRSLKTLQFEKMPGTSWADQIQFPNLEAVNGLSEPNDEFINFIARHTNIRTLKWRGIVTQALANAAPQLKELNMMSRLGSLYHLDAEGRCEPRFPLLEAVIVCHRAHRITTEQFDHFVRARCLPLQHEESLAKSPSRLLSSIMFRRRKSSPMPMWYESELYRDSRKRVVDVTCDPSFEEVYLTWSDVDY
jgi:hypothetical protein